MVHNLARGIPFATNSVDVVYHSNMLEHLDKEIAEEFLSEALRVLKPGGIHRIVVPDFEMACKTYVSHIALAEVDPTEAAKHDSYIARIIEQSVRRDAAGTRLQKPIRRRLENIIIGNARRRGETHQWMYDRINLAALLRMTGYVEPRLMSFKTSLVEAWGSLGLDFDHTGIEFQPGSFYMEAKKPISSRSADPQ